MMNNNTKIILIYITLFNLILLTPKWGVAIDAERTATIIQKSSHHKIPPFQEIPSRTFSPNKTKLQPNRDPLSCWACLQHLWVYMFQNQTNNSMWGLQLLPKVITVHIASFLDSVDILRLSGISNKTRCVFDGRYWISFLFTKPQTYSFLLLRGPLSPILHRKAFFSHLWYTEGKKELAARLGHPEAVVLCKYGTYGVTIERDQFVCSLGNIRDKLGRVDEKRTKKLQEAKEKRYQAERKKIIFPISYFSIPDK